MNAKKIYTSPTITDLGTAASLTRGGGGKGTDQGLGKNDGKGTS